MDQAPIKLASSSPDIHPGTPPVSLDERARKLAEEHNQKASVSPKIRTGWYKQGKNLPAHLAQIKVLLKQATSRLQEQTSTAGQLSLAAEWMLDNHYIAAQALREVEQDIPPTYEHQLPRLHDGRPRIYDLAVQIIQAENALLDLGRVQRFVGNYQEVLPLSMGELWALPTMLRLGILEYLLAVLSQLTNLSGKTVTEITSMMPTQQVGDQLIVENCIRTLRSLAVYDWMQFFETLSLVDATLRNDPAGLYSGMDFKTRDSYRKAVEEIAKFGKGDELTVARYVVKLARAAADNPTNQKMAPASGPTNPDGHSILRNTPAGWDGFRSRPETHVGYYLLGSGRSVVEKAFEYSLHGWRRVERFILDNPTSSYLGSIISFSLALVLAELVLAEKARIQPALLPVLFILSLVPAFTIVVELVNWIITQVIKPHSLPYMDFRQGIPEECSTLVVIPALLSGKEAIDSLLAQLEQHYLRNPGPGLFFALLTDFTDSPVENDPSDASLVERAREGIRRLNDKYPLENPLHVAYNRFALLHRERRWNPFEGVWMGWERKRGKLHELNRLILAAQESSEISSAREYAASFPFREGDLSMLRSIRYVITLDADTILPRDGARRLIEVLAHPLNRAILKPARNVQCGEDVISGYTILQPRTDINPLSSGASYFSRIYSGDTGLDLYTRAVSDVYQDLFGEGSYVGKGAYEVSSFERSLEGCIPDNTLLSHDLLEGIHGRTALVTDTVLVEDLPPTFLVHINRLHRWIRGDWQLIPFLFSPRLSGIGRWKILDNLRRSLVAPALFLFFLAGWLLLPDYTVTWTIAGVLVLFTPVVTVFWLALRRFLKSQPVRQTEYSLRNSILRWLLSLAFLPYEAVTATNAILKTLVRLTITRRGLLRWTTSAQAASVIGVRDPWVIMLKMIPSSLMAIGAGILIVLFRPASLAAAAPLLVTWFLAPGIAAWVSQPLPERTENLDSRQKKELRQLARRTWLFFEQFIGPEDQWLPPDHFQEAPLGIVAHRTSPTNIGMALLSTLAAYDFGYLDPLSLSTRLISSFETLEKLERFRGHFLNWYDTRSLEPLQPRYVSTVDSGNLAACLLVLHQSCLEIPNQRFLRWEAFEGLLDAINLLDDLFKNLDAPSLQLAVSELRKVLSSITEATQPVQGEPIEWVRLLSDLKGKSKGPVALSWSELDRLIIRLVEQKPQELGAETLRRLRYYNRAARQQFNNIQRSIDLLMPWLSAFLDMPDAFREGELAPDLAEDLRALQMVFPGDLSLSGIPAACRAGRLALDQLKNSMKAHPGSDLDEAHRWVRSLESSLDTAAITSDVLRLSFEDLARRSEALFEDMDFTFLFNPQRQVFHIGFNATHSVLDLNYYDLLASEARLASLVAIAKGQVPQSHWLHLGRPVTNLDGRHALLSWSATMFEYLMPRLVMSSDHGTLLGQTMEVIVDRQIEYGRQNKVPWGISESGYYRFDANQFYQYRAFGVPGLGYKRGLSDDMVIAPYASMLALPLRPQEVFQNMEHLKKLGLLGIYGYYEAADFTPSRLVMDQEMAIVQSYMAHHQGMIMLSLVNYLREDAMVRRFQQDPRIESVRLLSLEQIPRDAPFEQPNTESASVMRVVQARNLINSWSVDPQAPQPRVHYLSNGRYSILITADGGGYSTWENIDLTRWRPDSTLADWGTWIYIQDQNSGETWSASLKPNFVVADEEQVLFNSHVVEFRRRYDLLAQSTQVFVVPNDDLEVRLLTLTNHGNQPRRLQITSYGEVTLAPQATDARHPAFNKMFIESEPMPRGNGIMFRRRPRSGLEEGIFLAHAVITSTGEKTVVRPKLETDRGRFLGRGGTTRHPAALEPGSHRGAGGSLDPIFSISQSVHLPPHASVRLAFLTTAANTAEGCLANIDNNASLDSLQAALEKAGAFAEEEVNQLEIPGSQLKDFQTLLSLLVFPSPALRPAPERLAANRKGQSGLWPFAISGDYPILLVELDDEQDLALARDILLAHTYWRRRGLLIDLVFLDKKGTTYNEELSSQFYRLVARMDSEGWLNRRGGIFLLHTDHLREAELTLLETAARVVLDGTRGGLADHLQYTPALLHKPSRLPALSPVLPDRMDPQPTEPLSRPQGLLFDNGIGGFSPDGKEYCIYLEAGQSTPAPWINVIANPEFGFLASETGLGTSWSGNSGENRLSPWSNDPVSNKPREVLYLRDEETSMVWSPTAQPSPALAPYLARHGAGYTIYEHNSHGLRQHLRVFCPPDAPLKILHLKLENTWDRPRRITATYYVELVLGSSHDISQQYLIPEYISDPQALLVRNPYNTEFSGRVAFVSASNPLHGLTADRTEFLGRAGSLEEPAALQRIGLTGTVEAGRDPCAALQLHIDIQPGAMEQVYFILGQAGDRETALALVCRFQDWQQMHAAWEANEQFWDGLLGTIQVQTPDPSFDLLTNRWLLYQALACRIWGRTAFYQSSGAYGFRDQLQDVMALLHIAPQHAREHLLRAARHQFEAGDVLHWWHPPSGRGVRTRITDDLLWLPYVTAQYVNVTGDESILTEKVPFRHAPQLEQGQDERYGEYPETSSTYTLFEHCRRALEKGTTSGSHNLPLMGSGDWNDGMNRVGIEGHGESVWLGWFLYATLNRFADLCERRGQDEPAAGYRQRASDLIQALEQSAWDGDWYLRAFYDDGSPLGSSENQECQIDSISQSWAVLSGGGDPQRASRAMKSVLDHLVRRNQRLVLLLTPPFDKTLHDPGYIKGYPPGIRENGGQYTHAALWTTWAFLELGKVDLGYELFQLINPVLHADTYEKAMHYRVEPYVVAADVSGAPPYTGRGGWTWYTGSSSWMYRLAVEGFIGLNKRGDRLEVNPRIPSHWSGFKFTYKIGSTFYEFEVQNPGHVQQGVKQIAVDGRDIPDKTIMISEQGSRHKVLVIMG